MLFAKLAVFSEEGEKVYFRECFFYFIVFLAGILAGRLLNAIIYCYQQGESFRKLLENRQMFPVFFFFLQKNKYRDEVKGAKDCFPCFPYVELISSGIFIVCYYFFAFAPGFFKYVVVLELLLVVSVLDLKMGVIPDRFVLGLLLWLFAWQLFYPYLPLESVMVGFLAGGVLFYVIAVLSKGGMGGGDIKLMAVLGFAAGWPYVLAIFLISFTLGALAGVVLLASEKKVWKDSLAFAPFLSLGFFLVTFWGVNIWQWYASFL